MFEPRFAPFVSTGRKKCTIRKKGKRETRIGDLMDARQWAGKPYRSKTIKLIESPINKVQSIRIDTLDTVFVDGVILGHSELAKIAKADGFKDINYIEDFFEFFSSKYSIPFKGQIIHWD